MTQRLVVTGASGYIGARLVELARGRGCDVLPLAWRLGDTPPETMLAGATAVIHLGHSWASDAEARTGPGNINLQGTVDIAGAADRAGVPRFVFASTTSARAEALNAYGRIKYTIEQRLRALQTSTMRVLCARIALVYGGPEQSLFGLLSRVTALTPVLPMIGLNRELQPIHLDEVCEGLLRLALDPPASGDTFVLGSPRTVTFGNWLRILRRARTGRRLLLVPIPMRAVLLACDATRLVPFGPTVSRERVLGLAGAAPMDSAADLAALGIVARDPEQALSSTPAARQRLAAEAAAMLTYVAGHRIDAPDAVARLTNAITDDPASRRALPALTLRWPDLLRFIEPVRPSMRHGLSRRLHLAAMVTESLSDSSETPRPSVVAVAMQVVLEALALPFRLVLSRVYA
jgi:nucleoside-diphosphate-sugar epimerase